MRNAEGILGLILILAIASLGGCSDFVVYHTAGGIDVVGLRRLQDVYPVYGSTFKAEYDFSVKARSSAISATSGGQVGDEIVKLYQDLDQTNMDVRNQLVAAYTRYIAALSTSTTPDEREKAGEAFDKVQQSVAQLALEVRQLNAKVAGAKVQTSAAEWQGVLEQGDQIRQQDAQLKAIQS